jgi:hypothetical protein
MKFVALKSLANNETFTNICRLVGILICIGIVWRQQGITIFPIRLTDVLFIGPLSVAIFFKRSGRPYWFLWGMAAGSFVTYMVLLKYLVPGVRP